MNYQKTCQNCGTVYYAQRSTSKFCSTTCRVNNHKLKSGKKAPAFLGKDYDMTSPRKPKGLEGINANIRALESRKTQLRGLYAQKASTNPKVIYTLLGAVFGGAVHELFTDKNNRSATGALWSVLAGGALGYISSEMIPPNQKETVENLNGIVSEVEDIDRKINSLEAYRQADKKKKSKASNVFMGDFTKEKQPVLLSSGFGMNSQGISKKNIVLGGMSDTVSLEELKSTRFNTLRFDYPYSNSIGNPEDNFMIMVWGTPGQGKSTWTLKFSEYLANNHGRLLYVASEEGKSVSLQNKVKGLRSNYMDFTEIREYSKLKRKLESDLKYRFIVIDSVNDMDMTYDQFKALRVRFPTRAFVIIMQATKQGKYKGDAKFMHDSDVTLKIEDYKPITEKTRFK